ncbi:MAG: Lrp/AsnC family transcriptional regulator [Oscillospiraceae bacterium]|nr:Lrp/AsnC family transcriptional regulator [Oscillospiraceae bacterium]
MESILKLLGKNGRLTPEQLADILGRETAAVAADIKKLENDNIILGYKAIIDWERSESEVVTALIEVKVTPQRGEGFELIADRICKFDEVESLYLMSGGYDFSVLLAGRTMREVALFVALKLAPIEGVSGTATHFILKKYKDGGVLFANDPEEQERAYLV